MEFTSINNEIIEVVNIQQAKLDEEYEKLKIYINNFKEKIKDKPFDNMKETETNVQWLKEMVIFTQILQNYYTNFPNIKFPKNENNYITNNYEINEDTEISDKVYNTIIPLGLLLTTVLTMKEI